MQHQLSAILNRILSPIFKRNSFSIALLFDPFFANIFMFFVGLLGNKVWIKIIAAPKSVLYPVILALSFIGSYFIQNSVFDVGICIAFGILGWLLKRGDFPTAPVVLGLILGKMIEENLRLSLIKGEWIEFFTHKNT